MSINKKIVFTQEENETINKALEVLSAEVKKLMVKAEKLGLEEAKDLKETFLTIASLRSKIGGGDEI